MLKILEEEMQKENNRLLESILESKSVNGNFIRNIQ